MLIYPAIDLYEGQVVRLVKGRFDRITVYDPNPVDRARRIRDEGASCLHIVDLQSARDGSEPDYELLEKIAKESGLFVEMGGGIRDLDRIRRCSEAGISRVILGTAAVEQDDFLREAVSAYGEAVAIGADLLDGKVAIRGWEVQTGLSAKEFFSHLLEVGVKTVICTDISRDGMLGGSNRELYAELLSAFCGNESDRRDCSRLDLIASGGVSSLEEIAALRDLGLSGAIIGKAWYSGALSLREAISVASAAANLSAEGRRDHSC